MTTRTDTRSRAAAPLRRIVLLAGPSGSGKGRLGHLAGLPVVALDDFYRDHTEPGLPERYGIVDWDNPVTWNRDAALAALTDLAHTGVAQVPTYSIPQSRRIGTRELAAPHSPIIIAEGIFAAELVAPLRAAGLLADAIVLDRPRPMVFTMRFARDVRESRKALPALIARGWGLAQSHRADVDRWAAAGMRPMGLGAAIAHVQCLDAVASSEWRITGAEHGAHASAREAGPTITVSAVCFLHFTPPGPGYPDGSWRIFSVRKRGTSVFMQPGGKPEWRESALDCAVREIHEELDVRLDPARLEELGTFTTRAANEAGTTLHATVFLAPDVHNPAEMTIRAELEEARWVELIDPPEDLPLAPLMTEHIVPALRARLSLHTER